VAVTSAPTTVAANDVLDPDPRTFTEWMDAAGQFIVSFVDGLNDAPANGPELAESVASRLGVPPLDLPRRFNDVLATFAEASQYAMETAGPRFFGYIPGGGLPSSAIAEMLARAVNRQTAVSWAAPGLVAMEQGVLRWLCSVFGLPAGSGGLITTGASMGTLSAVVAARHLHLGQEICHGTLYVSEHTHLCVAKAARIAGIRPEHVRVVPVGPDLRMDVAAAARVIAADRSAGLRPFMLVGTAGTTDSGTVDPLMELATLARREDLWLHVDGAYGGFFQLTQRGQDRLVGISLADSITLDPHKSLFLPHGTGVLLVRDPESLRAAHAEDGPYLRHSASTGMLPNYADLGIELTRESRGLRLWLPLHLHGVDAFRNALNEKLDLAEQAHDELYRMPGIHVPWRPELSTVVFHDVAGNSATRRLLDRINASRKVLLSPTSIRRQTMIRMCVLSHRTHAEHVNEALEVIRSATMLEVIRSAAMN
jgi:aromatic-L-amino-acid/L-tryptophan decarboxylase